MLVGLLGLLAGVTVAVDVDVGVFTLNVAHSDASRDIFGVNFPSHGSGVNDYTSGIPYSTGRWGSQKWSRFNWEINAANSNVDWFFIAAGEGNGWEDYMDAATDAGINLLIQVPALGWVAYTTDKTWSFSVDKYGAQQASECTGRTESWWECDAGNGISNSTGEYITGNDPYDASIETYPVNATEWITAIQERYGAEWAYRFFIDNEPGLWHEEHYDVHPDGATFDEIWNKTRDWGSAIKESCPECEIMGYSADGYCGYFTSGYDKQMTDLCTEGDDWDAKGGIPLIAWYLQQASQFETDEGYRLVDYLDVHYYPQTDDIDADDIMFGCDEDDATLALRFASTRSLWDPTYVDQSWINTNITLIPWLTSLIDQYYPGTKLSISEYKWGCNDVLSGAIAQAEVFAIFATYGVDSANVWDRPATGTIGENGFNIFLDYDTWGSSIFPTDAQSVDALTVTTSNVETVTSYAFITTESDGNTSLYLMAFNKAATEVNVVFTLDDTSEFSTADDIHVFGMNVTDELAYVGILNDTAEAATFTLSMPPYSVRLITFAHAYTYVEPPATTDYPETLCAEFIMSENGNPWWMAIFVNVNGRRYNEHMIDDSVHIRSHGEGWMRRNCASTSWDGFMCDPNSGFPWQFPLDVKFKLAWDNDYYGTELVFHNVFNNFLEGQNNIVCIDLPDLICLDFSVGSSGNPWSWLQFTMTDDDGASANENLGHRGVFLRNDDEDQFDSTPCTMQNWGAFSCMPTNGNWTPPLDVQMILNTTDEYHGHNITFEDAMPDYNDGTSTRVCTALPDMSDYLCPRFEVGENGQEDWFQMWMMLGDEFINDYIDTSTVFVRSNGRDDWNSASCVITSWNDDWFYCQPDGTYGALVLPLDVKLTLLSPNYTDEYIELDGREMIFESAFVAWTETAGEGEVICSDLPYDPVITSTAAPDTICAAIEMGRTCDENEINFQITVDNGLFARTINCSDPNGGFHVRSDGSDAWDTSTCRRNDGNTGDTMICTPNTGEVFVLPLDVKFYMETNEYDDAFGEYDGGLVELDDIIQSFNYTSTVEVCGEVFLATTTTTEGAETPTTTEDDEGDSAVQLSVTTAALLLIGITFML